METPHSEKIKKYLFFVSIVFFVLISSHLIYSYIYNDAETTPLKWGTISEWIIGTTINLNPFSNVQDENRTILKLVYRSLLQYNPENGNFVKDLASCDIKNLKNIECFIEEWQKWSDGTEITIEDIFKTYARIKEVESDTTLYPLVKDITITKSEKKIIFSSDNSDINIISILMQPILAWSIADNMTERDLNGTTLTPLNMLYSGPYSITSVTNDETTDIKMVTLNRNPEYIDNEYHIEKINFRFFREPNHLIKYKSLINVFNDTQNILWEYAPRIQTFEYKLPKITTVFVNTNTIADKNFRWFLLEKINRNDIVGALWKNFTKTMNPLGTLADTTSTLETKDLSALVEAYEYYSKTKIVDYLLTDEQKEIIAEEEATKYRENPTLSWSITPLENKYTFLENDNLLLKGSVEDGTVAVYINDYKLTGYNSWDSQFFYRLEEDSYETITKGINKYDLYFEKEDGTKDLKTSFVVAYSPDTEILTSYKNELLGLKETLTYSNEVEIKSLSSEERDLKEKLDALDDNFYYNRDLEKFSLSLAYITWNINVEKTALIIKNTIETFWISVVLTPLTSGTLADDLSQEKNNYDLILVWLNLWYFNYDLFPYLHSSQVKNGYNLANFKKSTLDESLELLRSSSLSDPDEKIQKENIVNILSEEQILKSIYQPTERLLVDKNIKNFRFWEYLPNYTERINYIRWAYTLEEKEAQFSEKSVWWFMKFLTNNLF